MGADTYLRERGKEVCVCVCVWGGGGDGRHRASRLDPHRLGTLCQELFHAATTAGSITNLTLSSRKNRKNLRFEILKTDSRLSADRPLPLPHKHPAAARYHHHLYHRDSLVTHVWLSS